MAYADLNTFIRKLEEMGELVRIREPLDPYLEISEVTDRVCKAGGPALLFESVKGRQIPVLTNLFGSMKRMCLALEVDHLDRVGEELTSLLKTEPPRAFRQKLSLIPMLKRLRSLFPKTVSRASCQEVIIRENPDLSPYPVLDHLAAGCRSIYHPSPGDYQGPPKRAEKCGDVSSSGFR